MKRETCSSTSREEASSQKDNDDNPSSLRSEKTNRVQTIFSPSPPNKKTKTKTAIYSPAWGFYRSVEMLDGRASRTTTLMSFACASPLSDPIANTLQRQQERKSTGQCVPRRRRRESGKGHSPWPLFMSIIVTCEHHVRSCPSSCSCTHVRFHVHHQVHVPPCPSSSCSIMS
jgi:hypothetical protein